MKINRKLFAFDLDGTLLSNSANGEVPDNVLNMIKSLRKQGHVVCILTGRPWSATERIYETLELDTLVANYNGGHLHNPKDYSFLPLVKRMEPSIATKIITQKEIQTIADNIAIETVKTLFIQKNVDDVLKDFLTPDKKTARKIVSPIKFEMISTQLSGVLISVKDEYKNDLDDIKNYFDSRFGDLVEFSYWDTGKDRNPILEFTHKNARKDMALIKMARYYDISMSDVVAFGDGFNDVAMLKIAGVGVAMQNASDVVKSYANVIAKHTNKSGGVAKFIKWYLKDGHEKVDKTIYRLKPLKVKTINED